MARARRERAAEAAAEARRGHGPADAQPQDTVQVDAVAPAHSTAVVPVEGKASEVQLAAALGHQALIVTRPIEWGQVIFGYEQMNYYTVYDETGAIVALVAEDWGGLRKEFGRQFLRTRRSFSATVFNADGSQVLFRLRRPAYLISSTMYVEDGEGSRIGEIHQRWHMLKRNYDLYLGKSQFAAISGQFLAWEFALQDGAGNTLAVVDRNFQGFAKTLFTDAGKYVIHFGYKGNEQQGGQEQPPAVRQEYMQQPEQQPQLPQQQPQSQQSQLPEQPAAAPGAAPAAAPPPVTAMAKFRTDAPIISTQDGNQLVVSRPLELSERMVALACAVTIDFDFFSHTSHSPGLIDPLLVGATVPGTSTGAGTPPAGSPDGGGSVGGVPGSVATGAAAGTVDEAGLGGGGGAGEGAFGGGGDMGFGRDGSGAGGGEGMRWDGEGFDAGKGWGQGGGGDGEMKWDLGGDGASGGGGGGGGGDGGEGGIVSGVLGALWGLFGGD